MVTGTLERKLSAVVSADVVGYSRLMADDEAETVRTLGRYRDEIRLLVSQYRGRVVDFTGDNFLAEFPTASDAVACAVEIHRVVEARNAGLPLARRMHFRIGIHLGEVTVEDDRLYGDGVNIAARLEGLAEPGGICVSAAVHEQVRNNAGFSFEDLGPRELKNVPDPVHVLAVRPEAPVEVAPPARASGRRVLVPLALAVLAGLGLTLALALLPRSPEPVPALPSHFTFGVLGNGRLADSSFPPVAVSPDGRTLAYAAAMGTTTQLFLRSLDRFEAAPLAGTEGAVSPFFSADGRWVGFFAGGALHKVRTSGAVPIQICATSNFSFPSAHWGRDGVIRFSRGINVSGGMQQVSENGGRPEPLTSPDFAKGERWHGLPQQLPDGALLFTVATAEGYRAAVLPPGSREWVTLEGLGPAVAARLLPDGHLVFGQPGRLMSAPWNASERTAGTPSSVLDGVFTSRLGSPYFAASDAGTLVYAPGGIVRTAPVLLDRKGNATRVADDPGAFQHPRFSPDEKKLAVDITWRGRTDIYVYDLQRGTRRRLTHTGFNIDPLWSVDGGSIVFRSTRPGSDGQNIYQVDADGGGQAELVLASAQDKVPGSWTRGGSLLAYTDISPATRAMDIGILDLSDSSAEPLIPSPYNVGWPVFSPDGRWLAYVSDESGRTEVWVRPFPGPGAAVQISLEGGSEPVWSPDAKGLYFRRGTGFLVVPLETADGLRPGRPARLFEGRYDLSPTGHQHYDVDSQGRFAAIALDQTSDADALRLVLDWDLERLADAAR